MNTRHSHDAASRPTPESHLLADAGRFPNSRHPALLYRQVLGTHGLAGAAQLERLFESNAWPPAWRNGIYTKHHYHSTAHEVLGVYQGWVQARLGGEEGPLLLLHAGDVLVIPAGVAHCNEGQSRDFHVVGAYPEGSGMDMNDGRSGERPGVDRNILALPLPARDPVTGPDGALCKLWR
jgi:uncharacterized protein YjlB